MINVASVVYLHNGCGLLTQWVYHKEILSQESLWRILRHDIVASVTSFLGCLWHDLLLD